MKWFKKISFIIVLLLVNTLVNTNMCLAQAYTVNYTIPDWNSSGSYTLVVGSSRNQIKNRDEGYIKVFYENGQIIEINPERINLIIENFEKPMTIAQNVDKKINIERRGNSEVVNKLKELKLFLEDSEKVKILISKIQNKSEDFSLNWECTIQSVDDVSTYLYGTIDED